MAVDQIIDLNKFHEDIRISATNITNAYMDQASLFAYYAALYLKAMRQSGNFKIVRDAMAAKIDQEVRTKSATEIAAILAADPKAKVDRLTEAGVTASRNSDSRYINTVKDYLDAEAIETFLRNALSAFEQRRDMLISLGSTLREERKGEMRLMGHAEQGAALQGRVNEVMDKFGMPKG